MSIIAAIVLLAAPAAAATFKPAMTAEQVLAAYKAATSIGPDPCRSTATDDEIVVCGRRESPYALPGYDSMEGDAASKAGGDRKGQMAQIRAASSDCAAQLSTCRAQAALNVGSVVGVLIKAVKALTDGE